MNINPLYRLHQPHDDINTTRYVMDTRWRSWLRHCATSRKVAGSIPHGATEIFQ
jgi:hypothetical protein